MIEHIDALTRCYIDNKKWSAAVPRRCIDTTIQKYCCRLAMANVSFREICASDSFLHIGRLLQTVEYKNATFATGKRRHVG